MQIKNYVAVFNTWKHHREKLKSSVKRPPMPPISMVGLDFASNTITTSGPMTLRDFEHGARGTVVNYSAATCIDTEDSQTFTGSMNNWEM